MLSKTADYALRAVVWLARSPGEALGAEQLAEATQTPRRYLRKVLQDLIKAGLVRSQPGPGGGYSLRCDTEQIKVLDVVNAVGSIDRIRSCPLGIEAHNTLCPLHRELDKIYAATEQAFSRLSVAQLLKEPSEVAPLCKIG